MTVRAAAASIVAFSVACSGLWFATSPAVGASSLTDSWVRVAEPSLGHGALQAISCVSAKDCWAVGNSPAGAMVVHWNGVTWAKINAPAFSPGSGLQGVDCPNADDCWAVGPYQPAGSTFLQTLIEHWNGRSWARFPSPTPYTAGVSGDMLYSVSCESVSNCWAVGGTIYFGVPPYHAIILHWDGSVWVNVPLNAPPLAALSAVSCAGVADCWAVGNGIARLRGASWATVPPKLGAVSAVPEKNLLDVACRSSGDCVTGGFVGGSSSVLGWNGRAWRQLTGNGRNVIEMHAAACNPTLGCVLVGDLASGQTWSELWNGSKLIGVPTANAPITVHGPAVLMGIACPTAKECLAVGAYGSGSGLVLFERFTA